MTKKVIEIKDIDVLLTGLDYLITVLDVGDLSVYGEEFSLENMLYNAIGLDISKESHEIVNPHDTSHERVGTDPLSVINCDTEYVREMILDKLYDLRKNIESSAKTFDNKMAIFRK